MSYTCKNLNHADRLVFNYYSIKLNDFLQKNSAGKLFDFVENISNEYKEQNPLISFGQVKIDSIHIELIEGEDERIDKTLFYLGLVTFLKNITVSPLVSKEDIPVEVKEFTPLPLAAFDYKGHNKIDIKESRNTYSLLYE